MLSARTRWRTLAALSLVVIATWYNIGRPQGPFRRDDSDFPVDAATRAEVIDGVLKALDENYVFPEVAKNMAEAVRRRLADKEYDAFATAKPFGEALTKHLREVCKDKHLRVIWNKEPIPPKDAKGQPAAPVDRAEMARQGAVRNFGFEKVERLPGNVGYLDLRGFMAADLAGDTAAAAMNFLANTDALIIDLRQNGGGSPVTVALLCSYLLPSEPVHLNDIYNRPENATKQFWTLPHLTGKRYPDKPVYLLTSNRTFSGAEEFAYDLQNVKRATVVG